MMRSDALVAAIDRVALATALLQHGADFHHSITDHHAHLFAEAAILVSPGQLAQMQAVISAVEAVVRLPGWMSGIPNPNGHDKCAAHDNETCHTRFPHLNPLPEGEETIESLREFHVNPDGATSHTTKPASEQVAAYLPQAGEGTSAAPSVYGNNLGVFYGYDFHLNAAGAHLIEINTNAGGAFLNALLLQSQQDSGLPGTSSAPELLEHHIVEMFRNEWRLERDDAPLQTIAIVDEQPAGQYLYPEFILAQQMFGRAGMQAFIVDPVDLSARANGVYLGEQKIDLIYNRLTDFSLEKFPALLAAYQAKHVVLTPNPEGYQRYADKRNLVKLTDTGFLRGMGAGEEVISVLQQGIPQTRVVGANDAEQWWAERKQWFFKPVSGYGAKGAYRGDKITRRVFEEILAGDYVAQQLAQPGERRVIVNGEATALKFDVRCYVYDGKVQLLAARMYQGQTTNFRTPGGGFALVRAGDGEV